MLGGLVSPVSKSFRHRNKLKADEKPGDDVRGVVDQIEQDSGVSRKTTRRNAVSGKSFWNQGNPFLISEIVPYGTTCDLTPVDQWMEPEMPKICEAWKC